MPRLSTCNKRIRELWRKGYTDAEISRTIGLAVRAVGQRRQRMGLEVQSLAWKRRYQQQMKSADANNLIDLRRSRERVACLLAGIPGCGIAHLRLWQHLQAGPRTLAQIQVDMGRSESAVRRLFAGLLRNQVVNYRRNGRVRTWYATKAPATP